MLEDKRGVSAVIVTVLIILIAIIAVSILWVAIKGSLEETTEQINVDCVQLSLEITEASYAAGTLTVNVRRNPGEADLKQIKLLVDDELKATEDRTIGVLESDTITIDIEPKPTKVEIAGVVGDDSRTCDIADSADVTSG